MQLSEHFHDVEFACRDGSLVPERFRPNLLELVRGRLQPLRSYLGRPVVVLSGYRSPEWNAEIGGKGGSWHLRAGAADIRVRGYDSAELYAAVRRLEERGSLRPGGVGYYPTFLHLDIGPARGRYRDRAGNRYFSNPLPEGVEW